MRTVIFFGCVISGRIFVRGENTSTQAEGMDHSDNLAATSTNTPPMERAHNNTPERVAVMELVVEKEVWDTCGAYIQPYILH